MGISQSFGSLALLFSPIIAGLIAGLNIFYIYPVAALFVFISAIIFCVYIKKSSLEKIVISESI